MNHSRRQFLTGAAAIGTIAITGCRSSSPGSDVPSPSSTTTASDAEQVSALALWTAAQAAEAGSYGIGGALVHEATGRVLKTMPNRVFVRLPADVHATSGEIFVDDPTAHGERQLVSWYFAQRATVEMPPAEELALVTTVDPCLMCASSLLEAGFRVGVVAPDTYSGTNYTLDGQFLDLPEPLRARARQRFGYYAVDDVRSFQGGAGSAYVGQAVARGTYDECVDLYSSSADTVRAARRTQDTAAGELSNPRTDPSAITVVRAFEAASPGGFAMAIKDPRAPNTAVRQLLESLVRSSPGSTNACAFIDPFGNVLVANADQQHVNPLSTAFALCTRTYAQTRFSLAASPSTAEVAAKTLTNPERGTFVWLRAPDPRSAVGMFDIGAYGSTLGTSARPLIPSAFQYYQAPAGVSDAELQRLMYPLPPLYSSGIAIAPQRVLEG